MKKRILKNGLTVIYKEKDSDTIAIQVLVKTGPIYESERFSGIAHFIEHLLFETKKRRAKELSAEIESLGGIINAFTAEEFTGYFVHVPQKYFDIGLEILSDIIQNPAFNDNFIELERSVILEEIKLWNDDPKLHRWNLFKKALYGNHAFGRPVFGTQESMKLMQKEHLLDFYDKHYAPNNCIIAIVGNANNIFEKVEKKFIFNKKIVPELKIKVPNKNKRFELKEKRQVDHTYLVLGYKTPLRTEKDSYAFDIIDNILGYGISSRLADEIRTKRGLAYQVSSEMVSSKNLGYFAVFLSTDKKNIPEVKKIILNEFDKLQSLTEKELEKAKRSVEGSFLIKNVDPILLATSINVWEFIKDANLMDNYTKEINKVTLNNVKSVAKKYLNGNYTNILIEQ